MNLQRHTCRTPGSPRREKVMVIPDERTGVITRVRWSETRGGEAFTVIADKTNRGWEFSEMSMWEVQWYPMKSTAAAVSFVRRRAAHHVSAPGIAA